MKILAIRGRNIASLDGDFELDFTAGPLASAGIFAICGPTGAGKSTLLDVLCLALFARTPRTDRAKENEVWLKDVNDSLLTQGDPRNLLRRGTVSGYAETDFVALNSRRYRSRWTVRRARDKESGALQGFKVSLFDLDGDREETGSRKDIQARIIELIGLTFDQFTRSVLLAQNDFSTFLKADQSEKAALLEKLTGTEYFSVLSQMIYRNNALAKAAYEQVLARIDGVELLTEEEAGRIGETLRQTGTALQNLRNEKKSLEARLNWFCERDELRISVAQAREEYEAAGRRREESRDRAACLQLTDEVQDARSLYEAEKNTRKSREEKEAEQARLRQETERLDAALQDVHGRYVAQAVRSEAREKEYAALEPDIREARRLDTQLDEAVRLADEAEKDWKKSIGRRHAQEFRLKEIDNLLQATAEEILRLSEWQAKHRSRGHVADQIAILRLQLDKAGAARIAVAKSAGRKKLLADEAVRQEQEARKIEQAIEQKSRQLKETEDTITSLETAHKATDPESLRAALRECRQQQDQVSEAEIRWNDYLREQTALQQQQDAARQLRRQLVDTEQETERLMPLLTAARARKQAAEQIYDRAVWAVAGDAEEMRSHLESGKPCPVCGSTDHPYADSGDQLHQAFSAIRREVEIAASAYDETWKAFERCRQQMEQMQIALKSCEKEIGAASDRSARLLEAWALVALPGSGAIEPERRGTWLVEFKAALRNRMERLQQEEAAYNVREQQIRQLLRQRVVWQDELSSLRHSRQACAARLELVVEKQKAEISAVEEQTEILREALRAINELFGHEKWQAAWQDDAEKFRAQLDEFAEVWKQKNEWLQARQEFLNRSKAERQTVSSFLPTLLQEEKECLQRLDERKAAFRQLQAARAALLGGVPAAQVEERLRRQLEAEKKETEILQEAWHKQTVACEQHKATVARVAHDIQLLIETAGRQKQELEAWITGFNRSHSSPLTLERLAVLLGCDRSWLQNEREALQQLESAWIGARARLQERETHLRQCELKQAELSVGEATPETLRETMEQLDERIRQTTVLEQECTFKLRTQAENKRKVEDLLADLKKKQAVSEQWAKLNELAGSADGGKFRRIAQGYTLDVLLEYANVQLRMLSRRYRLQRVPDTLALQVIDHDMCDEVRTVHSLSGGESFLVSLALALGLSSLSSNRMQVESLFIDEGFGSLDAETLRTAMDVLESLHTQGRKIGVISHVQEMTERIPVRVKVEKLGNGRSCLCVVG